MAKMEKTRLTNGLYGTLIIVLMVLLTLTLVSATTWNITLTKDMTHYYNFNESTGTNVYDIRGSELNSGYNGTAYSPTIWTAGKVNNSLYGDKQYQVVGTINDTSLSTFTLSFWYFPNSTASNTVFFNNNISNDFYIDIKAGNNTRMFVNNVQAQTTDGSFKPNQWNFIVLRNNGLNLEYYVNNNYEFTINQNPTAFRNLMWGKWYVSDAYNTQGKVDEVGLWNRRLTDQEISDLYNYPMSYSGYSAPYVINSQTYNNPTISSSYESYAINITPILPLTFYSAYLVYNGTSYLATVTPSGTDFIIQRSLNIPTVTTNATVPFYWAFSSDLGLYNTTAINQTINTLALDNCSKYTNLLYNFTIYDQDNITALNSSLNININIAPYGTTNYFLNYSHAYSPTDNKTICINTKLNNSMYTINIVADYHATGYVTQFYYLDNGTLTNATNPTIKLYDLSLTPTPTTFLIKYSDTAGNPVPNAIVHLYRFYIGEGLYREVEMGKLDSQSQTYLHFTEEDVIYYFTVTLNNQLLYTTPTYHALCISQPCTVQISASTPFVPFPVTWVLYNGTSIGTWGNSTSRMVYLYFVSDNVHTVNMTLLTLNGAGSQVINSTGLTATAGTLSLFVPYPYGNQTFLINIYQDGQFIRTDTVNFGVSGKNIFGAFGIFLIILIVACLGLMASTDGVMVIVFAIAGLIISSVLYLLDMGWYIIIPIIIGGGLIIWKIQQRKR